MRDADPGPGPGLEGIDPVTFQIIKHRLVRVTDEAVEALKRVSGAPNTNEGHDLMVALYTAEGDLLTGGVGFLHHYLGASEATKHIVERYGDDIEEGDMFMLNDSYTAALHPPDVYIITPVFYEGELRAFSASFVHVADIGAVDPGGFSPNSTSVFHEGFQTPGIKLVEGGEMRQDVLETVLNMSRDPGMVELDLRSEIAANNVAKARMRELMDEYGPETVDRVGTQLIAQSKRKLRERLRDLPDGRWEERQYLDSAPEDRAFTVRLAMEKEGDSLTFDFDGTDEQSEYGFNCTRTATVGGVMAPLFPLLCHDMTWNDGIIDAVDVEAPTGTIVNAERPAPISIATIGTLQMCNSLATLAVSKLLGASDEYADRATGVWHGAHTHASLEVGTSDGTQVETLTDTFAGAGGARAFADGVDLGGEVVNIVARWGNAERHEANLPLVYLYRRYLRDSGGPGRYRGGVGHEFALTPVADEDVEFVDVVSCGRGIETPHSTGVFGGYPGANIEYAKYEDTGVLSDGAAFPPDDGALPDPEYVQWGVNDLDEGDVFRVQLPGSGGYGDPLERDPGAVRRDVADGKVAPETARSVYGVPVTDDGEPAGSAEEVRERRYAERLEAVDVPEASVDAGETEPTGYRFGPRVAVEADADGTAYAVCENCGRVIDRAEGHWKTSVGVVERPVSDAGVHNHGPEGYHLREFVCPDCGTLLDTEIAKASDPPLVSRLSV
ncbi:MAG: hydantoinase B/oxoprolinase family protein [Haloarculaceae archaeon]